ncbi:hypothetical protein L9F63_014439, partial [Diploptera punctata]
MAVLVSDISCIQNSLASLGLGFLKEHAEISHNLLDQLLKILLEDKDGEKVVSKYNVALFIEICSSYLISTIADIEHTFAIFKNVLKDESKENSLLFQGQCLITLTTVLLQGFEMFDEKDLGELFSEHVEFLLSLVKQNNNTSNVHVRSIAASCLSEIELCFPQVLKDHVDSMYTYAIAETSIAHQQYMSLLSLIMEHSLNENTREFALSPYAQGKEISVSQQTDTGFPDIKEMVSFLVDQFPLCSTEGIAMISHNIIGMMMHRPDLQVSAQVLKPLVLQFSSTYSTLAAHIVFLLEKELGSLIFQEKDNFLLLHQLLLNSSHPALSASARLLYLDWLNNYLTRHPDRASSIQNVSCLLPASFDGSQTLFRKLTLLSCVLKNRKGSSTVLLQALSILQKQLKSDSSVKLKSTLMKILYAYLCDHPSEISGDIPRLLVTETTEDTLFIPFTLNFAKCVENTLPESTVPSSLLRSLVTTFTQPDSTATLTTFHLVLDVFLVAIEHDLNICQPKAILNYLMKYVVCEDVCGLLSWSLGHKILFLCYKLMSNYDTVEYFYELCELLKVFISNSEDVDLLDRANMYHSLLVSLSNKKLKQMLVTPKQNLTGVMSSENTFHSTSSFCNLDEPVLQLTKEIVNIHPKENSTVEIIQDIPDDVIKLHMRHLSFVAQKSLIIKGRLETTPKFASKDPIEALAIFFTAPESWGRIEPIMIGHYVKDKPCIVDIECFLYKPYPAVVQV